MKPIVFDFFCGLGGWSEAFIAEGYRAIGFDIEKHDYGTGCYPGEFVLADVRSLSGSALVKQYGVPVVIVASPPCQEFSYMAMPWTKAKEKMRKILASQAEQVRLCDLFNQCFRLQREISEAAGHRVPMVVENVRGACRWVGKSRWNFGSFHLWGDVPALMPIPAQIRLKHEVSCAPRLFKDREPSVAMHQERTKGEGRKSDPSVCKSLVNIFPIAEHEFKRANGSGTKLPGNNGRRTDPGKGARFTTRDCGIEGVKQGGSGAAGFDGAIPSLPSKSPRRKQASAEIAKIPYPLAQWIARVYRPRPKELLTV